MDLRAFAEGSHISQRALVDQGLINEYKPSQANYGTVQIISIKRLSGHGTPMR